MFLRLTLPALLLVAGLSAGHAQDDEWRHAASLTGEPKYPEGFAHFDYVNPDAPKGGLVRLSDIGGFDTLNPVLPKGNPAPGLGLALETLMTPSMDEVSTMYGLIAESIRYPDDFSSVSFRLRPEAKWHDGTPITPEDVVWSFEKSVELSPRRRFYYQHVTDAEVTGEREVTFTFDQTGNRELPYIVGQLVVLPKHWWEGTDANGEQRDITKGTLEPPLSSGPYRIGRINPGKTISYERVDDYWGKDLPVSIGHYNIDEIRYEIFFDDTVSFEAFKADVYDWWSENRAKRWATAYDVPAVNNGWVVREELENAYRDNGVMVGFIPNLRRPVLQDPLVRRALNYAFDFETLRRTIFYDQYDRIDSFFYGMPIAASGLPEGRELEILETVRDQVPAEVFTTPYVNPVGGTTEKNRDNLREALNLLQQAGFKLDGRQLVDPSGQQLSFEILIHPGSPEEVVLAYQANLRKIGIDARIRNVDQPTYINRVRSRDFDMIYSGWRQSIFPGNEQRDYWGSKAADSENSTNYAGIANPAVDALIDRVVLAEDREELEAATRALDRVLMANQYVIPSYTMRKDRIARWDRYSRPETLPEFAVGFPTIWWWDEEKAAAIKEGGG